MKCRVCGKESGKYPLCRNCYRELQEEEAPFLYRARPSLVTRTEMEYLRCIKRVLPRGYQVQPQVNLASFIIRNDNARYQNELFRNVDFMITDLEYKPLLAIEINDRTHLARERQERDQKVGMICEEAGIPLITFWTSGGVREDDIRKRIREGLSSLPVERIPHFKEPARGCYIATCVYGSYDCSQVRVLRRFRDEYLEKRRAGRLFIRFYYSVSPILVKRLGGCGFFRKFWKKKLDLLVAELLAQGVSCGPYEDPQEPGGRRISGD